MKGVRHMKKDNEKIEKALAAAYRGRQGPEPGEDWEMSVMRSIRNMPDVSEKARWSQLIGRLFWETMPCRMCCHHFPCGRLIPVECHSRPGPCPDGYDGRRDRNDTRPIQRLRGEMP